MHFDVLFVNYDGNVENKIRQSKPTIILDLYICKNEVFGILVNNAYLF